MTYTGWNRVGMGLGSDGIAYQEVQDNTHWVGHASRWWAGRLGGRFSSMQIHSRKHRMDVGLTRCFSSGVRLQTLCLLDS